MQAPSGRVFDATDLELLRLMCHSGFITYSKEPITFESGASSRVYVHGRETLTENPQLMHALGHKIRKVVYANMTSDDKLPVLIGIPTAGTAMAHAATTISAHSRQPILSRTMRQEKKTHGAHQKWVDGQYNPGQHTYWLVDNVTTMGDSKIKAEARLVEDGYAPKPPLLIWIDRQQGAVDRLHQAGFNRIVVVYHLLDLVFAFGELGLWPKPMVEAVQAEIAAHQFIK